MEVRRKKRSKDGEMVIQSTLYFRSTDFFCDYKNGLYFWKEGDEINTSMYLYAGFGSVAKLGLGFSKEFWD